MVSDTSHKGFKRFFFDSIRCFKQVLPLVLSVNSNFRIKGHVYSYTCDFGYYVNTRKGIPLTFGYYAGLAPVRDDRPLRFIDVYLIPLGRGQR